MNKKFKRLIIFPLATLIVSLLSLAIFLAARDWNRSSILSQAWQNQVSAHCKDQGYPGWDSVNGNPYCENETESIPAGIPSFVSMETYWIDQQDIAGFFLLWIVSLIIAWVMDVWKERAKSIRDFLWITSYDASLRRAMKDGSPFRTIPSGINPEILSEAKTMLSRYEAQREYWDSREPSPQ